MQLYALDKSFLVLASHAHRDKSYICPECHGFVRIRGGERRQIHFYHARRPASCRQHGKSLAHLQIQLHLKSLIAGLTLEKRFQNRIADACWAAEKIVFEVQCSPISLEEAKSRCEDYQRHGFTPVWILHDKRFNNRRLSPAEGYLRLHTPTYFTDGYRIYDQFEVCHSGRRLYASPPLPIDAGRPLRKDLSMISRSWSLSFQGDLSDHDPNQWKKLEQKILHRTRRRLFSQIYKYLLYRLLEITTH
jgi:competence protein CoiA